MDEAIQASLTPTQIDAPLESLQCQAHRKVMKPYMLRGKTLSNRKEAHVGPRCEQIATHIRSVRGGLKYLCEQHALGNEAIGYAREVIPIKYLPLNLQQLRLTLAQDDLRYAQAQLARYTIRVEDLHAEIPKYAAVVEEIQALIDGRLITIHPA